MIMPIAMDAYRTPMIMLDAFAYYEAAVAQSTPARRRRKSRGARGEPRKGRPCSGKRWAVPRSRKDPQVVHYWGSVRWGRVEDDDGGRPRGDRDQVSAWRATCLEVFRFKRGGACVIIIFYPQNEQ